MSAELDAGRTRRRLAEQQRELRAQLASARRLGLVAAVAVVALQAAYLVCLVIGLATLPSPDDPIADPWFTALEVLILALMPFMVALMVAVHTWAPPEHRPRSLLALVFMALVAVITSAVHFSVLTLSRQEAFREMDWLFAFSWPSVVYALDILAWDAFFPLAVLLAIPAFGGGRLERRIRWLLAVSGVLAGAGLAGVFLNDMQVRNIGIVGYAVVFPLAAVFMGLLFARAAAEDRPSGGKGVQRGSVAGDDPAGRRPQPGSPP